MMRISGSEIHFYFMDPDSDLDLYVEVAQCNELCVRKEASTDTDTDTHIPRSIMRKGINSVRPSVHGMGDGAHDYLSTGEDAWLLKSLIPLCP